MNQTRQAACSKYIIRISYTMHYRLLIHRSLKIHGCEFLFSFLVQQSVSSFECSERCFLSPTDHYDSFCACGMWHVCSVTQLCLTLLQPHGLQPARLLCSWDSPGKNTGVDCHFLLQGIFPTLGLNSCLLRLLHWQADFFFTTEPPGKPSLEGY